MTKDTNKLKVADLLSAHGIKPDPIKDQFFLADNEVIKQIAKSADLNRNDTVLEVGAGIGNLTAEIAKHAGRVIAFEIDTRFRPFLDKLPANVEVRYENAWDYVQIHGKYRKRKEYNKVVANLPYSFVEPLMHNLTFLDYDKAILMVPEKMLMTTEKNGVFDSFFYMKVLLRVPKEKLFPVPKTNSVIIDLIRLPDPIESKNRGLFLRQYLYQHEQQKVKNSLVEGLVAYHRRALNDKLTKNGARKLIASVGIDRSLLEREPDSLEIYELVEKRLG
jgi:16S rRNA (adenine1518-N6/adenine1519-N6)-dimethyltransferase